MSRDDAAYREIQAGMIDLSEMMTPIFDAADGIKADMTRPVLSGTMNVWQNEENDPLNACQ